jgi:hypothetical protein
MALGIKTGGRKAGTPNKATVERRLQIARGLEDARNHGRPLAKDRLGELLDLAFEMMTANQPCPARCMGANGGAQNGMDHQEFAAWFDRAAYVAQALAKYESPQLRAVAVAHTPISRPPAYDLTRLSERQLQQLKRLLVLASPSTLAYADPQKVANGGSIKRNEMGCDRTKPLVSDCGVSRSAGLVGGVQTGSPAAAAPSLMRRNGRRAA